MSKLVNKYCMGFNKGTDGRARTAKNPLEGSTGDVSLNLISGVNANIANNISVGSLSTSGNAQVGNLLTDGYHYANGVPVVFGGSSTTTLPAGNITYIETNPADWPTAVSNVQSGLDTLANVVTNIQVGAGFTFSGPFSNDAQAGANGVAIGQVYYNSSGGLVVRQT